MICAGQGWATQEKDQYEAEAARPGAGAEADVHTTSKPLKINRDLLLVSKFAAPLFKRTRRQQWIITFLLLQYRAKVARTYAFKAATFTERLAAFQQSEAALQRCLDLDPVDPRTYVALGKLLVLQRRYDEARKMYEDGIAVTGTELTAPASLRFFAAAWSKLLACHLVEVEIDRMFAAGGQNEYLWQAWASLEAKAGKITQARKVCCCDSVQNLSIHSDSSLHSYAQKHRCHIPSTS